MAEEPDNQIQSIPAELTPTPAVPAEPVPAATPTPVPTVDAATNASTPLPADPLPTDNPISAQIEASPSASVQLPAQPAQSFSPPAAAVSSPTVGNVSPPVNSPPVNSARGFGRFFDRLKTKLAGRTQKRLDKILAYAQKKGSVTNDEVQKLVYVSDATATRYLSKLVKQGKLKPEGKTKAIRYIPV